MLVKIEARILIFPGTDFHFPSTSVPPGTFLGSDSGRASELGGIIDLVDRRLPSLSRSERPPFSS